MDLPHTEWLDDLFGSDISSFDEEGSSDWTPPFSSDSITRASDVSDTSEIFPATLTFTKKIRSSSQIQSFGNEGAKEKERMRGLKLKKHSCKFCHKLNTKMSTHLTRCHQLEPEVAEILKMRKGDPNRRASFIKIQDEGDFQHNYRVLRDKTGSLIPKYRKATGIGLETDYRACPHCKAVYLKSLLSKHEQRCKQKADGKRMKRGQCAAIGMMMLPLPLGTSASFFEKVISKLRDDPVSRLIRSDSLILQYGERLFSRRDIEEHSYGQINGRLRELGRLLQVLRENSEMRVSRLAQALDPVNFDLLVTTVKDLGQFSPSTNMCRKGSLVLKLSYSLKKCAHILKAEAIKNQDAESLDKCERFASLYAGDWSDRISTCASQSVQRAKMNKPKLLPSVADVEKVNNLLDEDCKSELYPTLAKATLAAITIFNRKRGGEVQRMKCGDYIQSKRSCTSPPDDEILAHLTNTEKELVKTLHRVEIRGKFNRAVPILLTPKMVENIEKVLAQRTLLGLDSEYLFVTPTGQRPYRGPAVLKEYAEAAKVSDPGLFTATSLRKQLATLSQAMAISDLSQDQLASFLGHDIRIHRNIYCQTLDVIQKAKVASVLFKVNRGVQLIDDSCESVENEIIEPEEEQNTSDAEGAGCEMEESGQSDQEPSDSVPVEENPLSHRMGNGRTSPPEKAPRGKKQRRQVRKRKPWTKEETQAVHKHLSECIVLNRVPQKHECERALASEPILRRRLWTDIKFYVYNMLKKRR
jgi:integrase